MKITGLITEYNPFHNGHLYHLKKAKELTGADAVIVIMSGNYVQRGAPAVMPKHLRAKAALEAGVPIVIELPVCYSTGSAEYFASGAISILEKLGCIDAICFGSECGDYKMLEQAALVLANEPEPFRSHLQDQLRAGISFPKARQNALKEYLKDDSVNAILEQPNNILGIEYIKALYTRHSSMKAYTMKRMISDYHDTELKDTCSSASAIRRLLWQDGSTFLPEGKGISDEFMPSKVLTKLEGQMPPACVRLLKEAYQIRYPIYSNDFSLLLKYKLLTATRKSLTEYMDVTDELANRIMNHVNDFITYEQFCTLLKTRDVTYTRISRALLHILLDIRKEDMQLYKEEEGCRYARILGFRKEETDILKYLKEHSSIPLITKLTQTQELSNSARQMLQNDIFASNLYESVITNKFQSRFIHEYQHSLVIV